LEAELADDLNLVNLVLSLTQTNSKIQKKDKIIQLTVNTFKASLNGQKTTPLMTSLTKK